MAIADLIIVTISLVASLLTFISGFGLGTLLLPTFAVFFPIELAVVMTAVVHLLNNVFKFGLLWKYVDVPIILLFGISGMVGAWIGSRLLDRLGEMAYLYPGILHPVSSLALVIGLLMAFFALMELVPKMAKWSLPTRYLVPGGILSGFFGGLSGHQGALRSIFLLRVGLGKQAFIATGVAIALLVDLTRIPIYVAQLPPDHLRPQWPLLGATTLAALTGAVLGKRWIPKITLAAVQRTVAGLMLAVSAALIAGVI